MFIEAAVYEKVYCALGVTEGGFCRSYGDHETVLIRQSINLSNIRRFWPVVVYKTSKMEGDGLLSTVIELDDGKILSLHLYYEEFSQIMHSVSGPGFIRRTYDGVLDWSPKKKWAVAAKVNHGIAVTS